MFATLLGSLPDPPAPGDAPAAVLGAQVEAGLEPLTDGRPAMPASGDGSTAERWRATAAATDRTVKAVLAGPYSATRLAGAPARYADRRRMALAAAEAIQAEIVALAATGCPLVEIVETAADRIGEDGRERRLFVDAHRRLAERAAIHLSLSITGGSAWAAGAATILDPPYASLAVDLIEGPDNWRLVAELPADRGVIVGVLGARRDVPDGNDVLLYAAHYAASTRGRGLDRVGLGTAGSLASLAWPAALEKLRRLGAAARLAVSSATEQAWSMDPRAVSIRAAAVGRPRRDRPGPAGR
jgi:methionine synthase II (cobalamin-independent)